MNLSSIQRAYIAGFLDGDGSVYVRAKPNISYKFGFQIAPAIILFQSQKCERHLIEIHKMLGLGYIRERKKERFGFCRDYKPAFQNFGRMYSPMHTVMCGNMRETGWSPICCRRGCLRGIDSSTRGPS